MVVRRRKWLTDQEFSETFGICQILPGAVGANFAVMLGNRFCGWRGGVLALLAFGLPAMFLATFVAMFAIDLAKANPHVANAEFAISSAAAGLFASNGLRLVLGIARRDSALLRTARLSIVVLGIILVAGFHLFLPIVVVVILGAGMLVEWRLTKASA
jgi:chromate transporter